MGKWLCRSQVSGLSCSPNGLVGDMLNKFWEMPAPKDGAGISNALTNAFLALLKKHHR